MKKKFFGKVCAAAVALSCIFNASVVPSLVTAETGVKYEFEDGSHPNSVVPEEALKDGWTALPEISSFFLKTQEKQLL